MSAPEVPLNRTEAGEPSRPLTADSVMRQVRELGPGPVIAAALCASLPAIGGFTLLGFAPQVRNALVGKPATAVDGAAMPALAQSAPVLGSMPAAAGLYALLFALGTGLAILPTYALSGVAGFIFGLPLGSAAAMAGITLGALIGYGWGRFAARDRVMSRIEANPRARIVRAALVQDGFLKTLGAVTLVRIPPNSPFALTNLLMAALKVNPLAMIVGTVVGMAPRTILAVWLGSSIADAARAVKGEQPAPVDAAPGDAAATDPIEGALAIPAQYKLWVTIGGIVLLLGVVMLLNNWAKNALKKAAAQSLPGSTAGAAAGSGS